MAFIWTLLLLGILWLCCANDKANRRMTAKNFPSCKYQEEFLYASELYCQYRDEGRQDPSGDAWYDARRRVYDQGYLPTPLDYCGRREFSQHPLSMRGPMPIGGAKIDLCDPPKSWDIDICRSIDEGDRMRGFKSSPEYLKSIQKDVYYDEDGWKLYCSEIRDRFWDLLINRLAKFGLIDGKLHRDANGEITFLILEKLQVLNKDIRDDIIRRKKLYDVMIERYLNAKGFDIELEDNV